MTHDGHRVGIKRDDWFDYRRENDPQFAKRMESVRARSRAGTRTGVGTSKDRLLAEGPAPSSERLPFLAFLAL
jgi:hypothetical protein